MEKNIETLSQVIIKFAGDSGDGMQLTGTQFTNTAALFGNDLSTFPDFPAEIRAPQGTLPGVSGYQLHFGSVNIYTPGDQCDVLVAMNAAALKANLVHLKTGGTIIANTDGFDAKNLRLAKSQLIYGTRTLSAASDGQNHSPKDVLLTRFVRLSTAPFTRKLPKCP